MNVYREVEREIFGLLAKVSPDHSQIDRKIAQLARRLGTSVYSELLYSLCHLEFPAEEAETHWRSVMEHVRELGELRGSPVDLRVALLDYFISVNRHFVNPKIIEIKIFQKTERNAIRDEMSGLYNYRYFRSELDREIKRAERDGTPLSLMIFDIDYFKWYNDQNGHLEGDKVIKLVAEIVSKEVRDVDLVARYGGEEFVVLLPGANKPEAFEIAVRIREKVARFEFPFGASQPSGKLTISGGVASFRADASSAVDLIDAADRGLYLAKGTGKNQVLSADAESRSFPRVGVVLPGKVQLVASQSHKIQTRNVSEQGIQFVCDVLIREGEFFRFTLPLPRHAKQIEALGRAVRVQRAESDSEYDVGAEIVEMGFPDTAALRDYLENVSEPSEAISTTGD